MTDQNIENSLPEGWVETTLGDVVEIKYGKDHKKLSDGDIPCYGSGGLMRKVEKSLYDKPSVLIPRKGTISNLFYVTEPFWTVDTLFYTKINEEKIFHKFLFYKLKIEKLADLNTGSAVPSLTTNVLNQHIINIPKSVEEQKAIASILSSFDDKIELLREQNETLEKIGQEIFKEWFGKYKVNSVGREGPLGDKIGGELPEGWRVGKLGEEFDISIGRTPPRAESEWFSTKPIGKKWVSIKDMGNSGVYIFSSSEYLTDDAIEKFNVPIIPKNTTILSFKMTVGKLAITTEDMLSNEAIAHLKITDNTILSTEFIYCYLKSLNFNSLGSTSSIVTSINSTMIKELQVVIPDDDILEKFNNIIKSKFDKIKNNSEQIQSLSKTRDVLLPKLMKGEVRVEF